MTTTLTRRALGAASLALLGAAAAPAGAQQNWPSRPVTLVVPYAAGGSTDAVARILAQRLSTDLGQNVVVDNRSGATGTIGMALVAKANPNIFLDLSLTFAYFRDTSVATDLAFAAGRLPAGHVLYGSDFPDVRFADYLPTVREHTAGLDAARADALFSGTARALYRLE